MLSISSKPLSRVIAISGLSILVLASGLNANADEEKSQYKTNTNSIEASQSQSSESSSERPKNILEIGSFSLIGFFLKEISKESARPDIDRHQFTGLYMRNFTPRWSLIGFLNLENTKLSSDQGPVIENSLLDLMIGPLINFQTGDPMLSFYLATVFGVRYEDWKSGPQSKDQPASYGAGAVIVGSRYAINQKLSWSPEIQYQRINNAVDTQRIFLNLVKFGYRF